MNAKRNLFGIQIDALRMPEAVSRIQDWADTEQEKCRYVVTPNVDHTVLLRENKGLRDAYKDADLVLPDGHPLVWASRLLRQPLPERVPGSDLVPALFDAGGRSRELRVFLLGAAPGVAVRAVERMKLKWPHVQCVGVYSPPMGFEKNESETTLILGRIALTRPDILVVGLGAPKQEIWVHQNRDRIRARVALCVGATIDFLAGEKSRAPRWMQSAGIEWMHRMMSEPRRLVRRYARDAWVFPQIVLQQIVGRPFHST